MNQTNVPQPQNATAAQKLAAALVASGIPMEHVEILNPEVEAELIKLGVAANCQ